MSLFVDTSVWSLAFRRGSPPPGKTSNEVNRLASALEGGEAVFTTGLILQKLLQGFAAPEARERILEHFAALPLVVPDRDDHIEAAGLQNACRRKGIQLGTINALLAQLCMHHRLTLLTTDREFNYIAELFPLTLWNK